MEILIRKILTWSILCINKEKKGDWNYWMQKRFRKRNQIGLRLQKIMTYKRSENVIPEVTKRTAYFRYMLRSVPGSVRIILEKTHTTKSLLGESVGVRVGTQLATRGRYNNVNVKENHYWDLLWLVSCWKL